MAATVDPRGHQTGRGGRLTAAAIGARRSSFPLHRAQESAGIEQQILAVEVAGMGAAQECAGVAEFLGRAEALARYPLLAGIDDFLDRLARLFGDKGKIGRQSIGLEGAR